MVFQHFASIYSVWVSEDQMWSECKPVFWGIFTLYLDILKLSFHIKRAVSSWWCLDAVTHWKRASQQQ